MTRYNLAKRWVELGWWKDGIFWRERRRKQVQIVPYDKWSIEIHTSESEEYDLRFKNCLLREIMRPIFPLQAAKYGNLVNYIPDFAPQCSSFRLHAIQREVMLYRPWSDYTLKVNILNLTTTALSRRLSRNGVWLESSQTYFLFSIVTRLTTWCTFS
jgi:hypothetical protein